MAKAKKTRGFAKNAAKISKKQEVSEEAAERILAKGARNASAKAKKANPRLKRVK